MAAGYADFPLIAFHFEKVGRMLAGTVPRVYALAMAMDAAAALLTARLFDRFGLRLVAVAAGVSALFAPLAFFDGPVLAVVGVVLWGIGMRAQESIMRAAVADIVASERRATAYGVLNAVYGVAWFLGSALMGVLYDVSVAWFVAFSLVAQLVAVPVLLRVESRRP